MYKNDFKLTKDNILKYVTQEDIFEQFLGVRPVIRKKLLAPYRKDKNPDCYFYMNGNKLRFRDPAYPLNEDCFGIVMKLNRCNFGEALELIASHFDLIEKRNNKQFVTSLYKENGIVDNGSSVISPAFNLKNKESNWRKEELAYWAEYYITPEILKEFKVFSINAYYINGSLRYMYSPYDIGFCYAQYEDGEPKYKMYHPLRDKYRFISTMSLIDGYTDLPETGELLLITKSRKDRMCLSIFGIISIAPQAEGNYIPKEILEDLDNRFETIIILYDFDRAGVIGANRLKREMGWQPIFFTNGRFYTDDYKAKDFGAFLKNNGIDRTQYVIDYAKEQLLI